MSDSPIDETVTPTGADASAATDGVGAGGRVLRWLDPLPDPDGEVSRES